MVSVYFLGKGTNLLNIKANAHNLNSQIQIDDLKYYNNGSNTNRMSIDSGVICTSNGDYITISGASISSEKYVKIPIGATGDWEWSVELVEVNNTVGCQWIINNNSHYGNTAYAKVNGTYKYATDAVWSDGDVLTIQQKNNAFNILKNNNILITYSSTNITLSNFGFYINPNRIFYIKNIKLREL